MDLKDSRMEENLRKVFDQELGAYFEYCYAAKAASDERFELVANIFHQAAQNEAEHSKHEFQFQERSSAMS